MKDNKGFFDWNGNGKTDLFDYYVNMKLIEDISSDQSSKHSRKPKSEIKGISFCGRPFYDATKDNSGVSILKALLVTVICVVGIVIPIATEMEGIGVALFPLGAAGISALILKNT